MHLAMLIAITMPTIELLTKDKDNSTKLKTTVKRIIGSGSNLDDGQRIAFSGADKENLSTDHSNLI
jgi:hypothetical protein